MSVSRILFPALLLPLAVHGTMTGGPPCAADSSSGERQAKVWYLGHCGYAVRTPNHLLIFDYIELEEEPTARGLDEGFVDPARLADLEVTVFVTHAHVDHYDKVILGWRETNPRIRYVFGWPSEAGPGRYPLPGPRASLSLDGLTIHTVNSHHSDLPEVAFLVQVDGLSLFHGGDYQGKMARGAPSNVVADMAYLRTKTGPIDLLFLGAWTGEPYLNIIRGLEPRLILPMHDRKREERYADFAARLAELGFAQPVLCPRARGESFSMAYAVTR